MTRRILFAIALFCVWHPSRAQEQYLVNPTTITAKVPSTLWGIFFEDINRSADGGLYAELVKNRGFDFDDPVEGWKTWSANPYRRVRDGIFMVINQSAVNNKDPKFMRVTLQKSDTVGLINEGFEGMGIKRGIPYTFSLRFKVVKPGTHVRVFLFNNSGGVIGRINDFSPKPYTSDWSEQTATFTPTDTARRGTMLVIFEGGGEMDVDGISLFPGDTWKRRPGGLRNDLAQKIYDLHPGFMRFPGGCVVEGKDIAHRYQWKNTIGPIYDRKTIQSIWADDVPERQTPDYYESYGLGFYEYFQLCEDIGASPMPILNCGLSCQFDAAEVVPVSELSPYVKDALDLIEFANGSIHSKWGAVRAKMGHPAPFHMKLLGVGNENWGPQYLQRLKIFSKGIKSKYPYMRLVCATGYSPNPQFHYMDSALRAMHVDIIDEHYYMSPDWFYHNSDKYDHYDRKGPKIFVGEYAAQSARIGSLENRNTLKCALSEAAFMTGIERNSDVVQMASYAPLMADISGWQWRPDLIWFDNTSSFGTPSYYVQQLFSVNKGKEVVPFTLQGNTIQGQDSIWASAVRDGNTLILKIVNANPIAKTRKVTIEGSHSSMKGTLTTLGDMDLQAENSIKNPTRVAPKEVNVSGEDGTLELTLPPYSFSVVKVSL
ncbi:MAG: alpha-L-arabinofuranosidase [Bacteroidota bacterium]|nr:alpha-L-arabinofuranosidase [Bacteroidota bacterium]